MTSESARILVTGATGLLGTDIVRLFREKEFEVLGWSRNGKSPQEKIDLLEDARRVIDRMREFRPDVVIHTAAMSDVDGCEKDPQLAMESNVEAVKRVAQGCEKIKAALIAVSTDYVFDGQLERAYREEDEPHPISVYGLSKLNGEKTALAEASSCVIIRVSGLFGGARSNFVTQAVERFRAGQPVPVVTDQRYSPSYTQDIAGGLKQLVDKMVRHRQAALAGGELYGVFHLVNEGAASRLDVAQAVAEMMHIPSPERFIQMTTWAALQRPARRPLNSELECARFKKMSGTSLRPWRDALADFLKTMEC